MRLIDADELKMNMFAYAPPEMIWDHGDVDHKINEMPTIDAVPVVRCKDCKHFMEFEKPLGKWPGLCRYYNFHSVKKNDFCSCGQEKEI